MFDETAAPFDGVEGVERRRGYTSVKLERVGFERSDECLAGLVTPEQKLKLERVVHRDAVSEYARSGRRLSSR